MSEWMRWAVVCRGCVTFESSLEVAREKAEALAKREQAPSHVFQRVSTYEIDFCVREAPVK